MLLLVAVVAAGGIGYWWWQRPPPPDRLVLRPASFADLPGWQQDQVSQALPALLRSCGPRLRQPKDRRLGLAGSSGDWAEACAAAQALPGGDDAAARQFFETYFRPVQVTNRGAARGLFTGYFEISVNGSLTRSARYHVPLYLRPPDLVAVDLGDFRPEWKGQRLAGRVVGGALKPYPDRSAIVAGALADRGLELVWLDDPVDAFFLEVQGSGRVTLDSGGELAVGYAAQNGRPYVSIGRELIVRGDMQRGQVSLQTLRAWLAAHPDQAQDVMNLNPSYVFFRRLRGDGPLGAEGVALTPGRSLAVDRHYLPLGVPVWLDATRPAVDDQAPDQPLQRLLVAQDTGGAIRGPVRGDVFWGHGADAAAIAGRMQNTGRYWLLLPKVVAARDLADAATATASRQ